MGSRPSVESWLFTLRSEATLIGRKFSNSLGRISPHGLIFPISAAMLHNMATYDAALESFSKPLIPLIDYTLDEDGLMKVHHQIAIHYPNQVQ